MSDLDTRKAVSTRIWQENFEAAHVKKSLLIASTFRSGSTFVAELLSQNGLPGADKERFADSWQLLNNSLDALNPYMQTLVADVHRGCFSAKIMWPHLTYLAAALGYRRDEAAMLSSLFEPAQWIQVSRADKFSQAISLWRAQNTGQWHVYDDSKLNPRLEYDFKSILKALREIELHDKLWDDFFACAEVTPLRIVYEEIEIDPAMGVSKLLLDLGEPSSNATGTVQLKRQNDDYSAVYRNRFLDDLWKGDWCSE